MNSIQLDSRMMEICRRIYIRNLRTIKKECQMSYPKSGAMTKVKIKRPIGSVWKDEECERKYMWKLQAPKGILSFSRKTFNIPL